MPKRKSSAFEIKFLETVENAEKLSKLRSFKQYEPFDLYCPNNDCPLKNGSRNMAMAMAWKHNDVYITYCSACGQNIHLTKDEIKSLQKLFKSEKIKEEPLKKLMVHSLEAIEEDFLDKED